MSTIESIPIMQLHPDRVRIRHVLVPIATIVAFAAPMALLAQLTEPMTGAKEAIERATQAGWTEGLVAFILVASLGFLVWLVRTWLGEASARETRLSDRINKLEDARIQSMIDGNKALTDLAVATDKLVTRLEDRPCFLHSQQPPVK